MGCPDVWGNSIPLVATSGVEKAAKRCCQLHCGHQRDMAMGCHRLRNVPSVLTPMIYKMFFCCFFLFSFFLDFASTVFIS